MSQFTELQSEIKEVRTIVENGFKAQSKWQNEINIAIRGQKDDDVWGINQKIKYHYEKIRDHEDRILTVEIDRKKAVAWVLGAGSGAGLVGGIVFHGVSLLINLL